MAKVGGARPGAGRKKGSMDPLKANALGMLKKSAPAILEKALSMVLCDEPNVVVLNALIKKIFPDNMNLGGDADNPLRILLENYGRPKV